jgi:CspA family cold shock protein
MATGIVNNFNDSKGFGFITPTEGGRDLYVHTSSIQAGSVASLREGVRVEHTPGEGPKGPIANDVRTVVAEPSVMPTAGVPAAVASDAPKVQPAGAPVAGSCATPVAPQPGKA